MRSSRRLADLQEAVTHASRTAMRSMDIEGGSAKGGACQNEPSQTMPVPGPSIGPPEASVSAADAAAVDRALDTTIEALSPSLNSDLDMS
jgi:hypothetical protein